MKHWTLYLLFAVVLPPLGLGCDGDDTAVKPPAPNPTVDAGPPIRDGGPIPGDGSTNPDGMAPDAGPCDFAEFVTSLIKTQTSATSAPSVDLGQACTDKRDPTQFAPLFP
jgi:hypothetical protein